MPPEGSGDYPQPGVAPELYDTATPCNKPLPVGEVLEWFDFGQFAELFADRRTRVPGVDTDG